MPTDRFFIAPYDQQSGMQTNVKPWLIPDEAFSQLTNAYVFRGRVRKRFGSRWLGESALASRLRFTVGVTTGGTLADNVRTVALDAGMRTAVGQAFSVLGTVFTVFNATAGAQQMYRSDGSGATATYNLTDSAFNITATGAPDGTPVYFYLGEPVMGLLTYENNPLQQETVIGFDRRYAYEYISGSGWKRLNGEATAGAAVWTGDDSHFFWNETWVGTNASLPIFFVTNYEIADGIRYYNGTNWNIGTFYYDYTSIGTTDGAGNAAGIVPAGFGAIGQSFVIASTIFTVVIAAGALAVSSLTSAAPVGTGTFDIATGAYTFAAATANRTINFTNGFLINTCRIIVAFKNRLLFFGTRENNISYPNRCRYSQVGSPLDASAWFQSYPGKGNALDATTTEAIVTVEFVKDRLIVFFEQSTWELVYVGNQAYPFTWQKINTELGAESPFSIVPFDKVAIGVGNVGIMACNGANVERIDDKIPQEVFDIHFTDDGILRVYGIRDYYVEMIYWTFPSTEQNSDFPYPNRVLVYNYKTGTWSFNEDSITCFGYFQPQTGVTWDSDTVIWDNEITWDSGSLQAFFRQVVAGNQEGYTFICDADVSTNAAVLQITDLQFTGTTVTLTVINHNLKEGDYIYLQGITGTGTMTSLNGVIFQVINSAANPITSNTFSFLIPAVITGVYSGAGLIARVSNIVVQTKEYNFYAKQGRNSYVSKIDFMVDTTPAGQMQVDFFVATSVSPLLEDSLQQGVTLGTGTLDTFAYTAQNALLGLPVAVPIELEGTSTRVWHPVYFWADGEVIQLQLTMNDSQMRNVAIWQSDFQLHAMCIYAEPTSDRFQ